MQVSTIMGPGPVLGGKAGDQDYSLSSMLEHAPIKKQAEPGKASSHDRR